MTTATARRTPADKHDERRRALADSALRTLGELGYARASLREIAKGRVYWHRPSEEVVREYIAELAALEPN